MRLDKQKYNTFVSLEMRLDKLDTIFNRLCICDIHEKCFHSVRCLFVQILSTNIGQTCGKHLELINNYITPEKSSFRLHNIVMLMLMYKLQLHKCLTETGYDKRNKKVLI